MALVHHNGNDPYGCDDIERKQEFHKAVAECKDVYEKKVNNVLIGNVFQTYREDQYTSELIARAPQLLVEHSENEGKLVKSLYPKLFAYFFKYIYDDIEKTRPRSLKS